MAITLGQILDAISNVLGAATGLAVNQHYDELTEGINDQPLLQVYPESGSQDLTGNVDRTTFQAMTRQTDLLINADLYARQRSHIGEDMNILVDMIDAMMTELEKQKTKPYFGLDGIKGYHWSWQRVTFNYGDALTPHIGARFTIWVRVF